MKETSILFKLFRGMKKVYKAIILLSIVFVVGAFAQQPSVSAKPDSQYAFLPIKDVAPDTADKPNSVGLDIMLGNSGFGMGFFYRQALNGTLSWTFSLSASEAKAPNEVDYIDPFTGQKYVPGKVNQLFVFPVMVGLQYRLFKDQITDTFRPYVYCGIGPNTIFSAPYNVPLSTSISHGRGYFGLGAYFGGGAYFGLDPNSLVGVSVRYYILPMSHGIESLQNEPMANFNTFFITFNIATQY